MALQQNKTLCQKGITRIFTVKIEELGGWKMGQAHAGDIFVFVKKNK